VSHHTLVITGAQSKVKRETAREKERERDKTPNQRKSRERERERERQREREREKQRERAVEKDHHQSVGTREKDHHLSAGTSALTSKDYKVMLELREACRSAALLLKQERAFDSEGVYVCVCVCTCVCV
jgi:hypothetical protein